MLWHIHYYVCFYQHMWFVVRAFSCGITLSEWNVLLYMSIILFIFPLKLSIVLHYCIFYDMFFSFIWVVTINWLKQCGVWFYYSYNIFWILDLETVLHYLWQILLVCDPHTIPFLRLEPVSSEIFNYSSKNEDNISLVVLLMPMVEMRFEYRSVHVLCWSKRVAAC